MKAITIAACLLMVSLTGCTAAFTGDWLEEGVPGASGKLVSPTGGRRMALNFDPVSGVRYGAFNEHVGLVDNVTVGSDSYYVLDGWNKAQFGSMLAHVDGDRMSAGISGGTMRTFRRVNGPSIFPPMVQMPSFTHQ